MSKFNIRKRVKHKWSALKTKGHNSLKQINASYTEAKQQAKENQGKPGSKRRSAALGFSVVMSIFGLAVLGPKMAAIAKDVPGGGKAPSPSELAPSPAPPASDKLVEGISGAAAAICGLAVTSGSFMVGIACGVVVVYGILKVQGK